MAHYRAPWRKIVTYPPLWTPAQNRRGRHAVLKGVRCPRGYVSSEECAKCALNPLHPCPFTPDILAMMRREDDEEPGGLAFTPSRLLDCPRKQFLMESTGYYVDVRQAWPAVRGHMVHALFEQHGRYPGALLTVREVRLEAPIATRFGPATLAQQFGGNRQLATPSDASAALFQGKPDLIVGTSLDDADCLHLKVVDYKSKSEIKHDLVRALPEHQVQLNMYAWLVTQAILHHERLAERIAKVVGHLPERVLVDELEVVYCDMRRVRRFTSAGPLTDDGKLVSRHPEPVYEQLILDPVELIPLDRMERFIRARIEVRLEAAQDGPGGTGTLPPPLGPDESWRCRYCSVYDRCRELAAVEKNGHPKGGA
jgi:hypothetical protein